MRRIGIVVVMKYYELNNYFYIVKGFFGTASASNIIDCALNSSLDMKTLDFVTLLN